jgi:hypothetical protein
VTRSTESSCARTAAQCLRRAVTFARMLLAPESADEPCECQSGLAYGQCCKPFHDGEKWPETPLQLMRSRQHPSFLVPAVPRRVFPAHTRVAVVCNRRPERECARAWGGGHRYTGYAYRLPDWIIDTTHRVSASTTTLTHPPRHTLLYNAWVIFTGARMHPRRVR